MFVPCNPFFSPALCFKPSVEPPSGAPHFVLPTNVPPNLKLFEGTNALAYYAIAPTTNKKRFYKTWLRTEDSSTARSPSLSTTTCTRPAPTPSPAPSTTTREAPRAVSSKRLRPAAQPPQPRRPHLASSWPGLPIFSATRGQCYKTFFGRNLRLFTISWSIFPREALPAYSNVCG